MSYGCAFGFGDAVLAGRPSAMGRPSARRSRGARHHRDVLRDLRPAGSRRRRTRTRPGRSCTASAPHGSRRGTRRSTAPASPFRPGRSSSRAARPAGGRSRRGRRPRRSSRRRPRCDLVAADDGVGEVGVARRSRRTICRPESGSPRRACPPSTRRRRGSGRGSRRAGRSRARPCVQRLRPLAEVDVGLTAPILCASGTGAFQPTFPPPP